MKKISTTEAIERVLLTPLGSRVMRPEFGSRLFELVDRNFDDAFVLDAIGYTYEAIEKNLKEVHINKVIIEKNIVTILCEDEGDELEVRIAFR